MTARPICPKHGDEMKPVVLGDHSRWMCIVLGCGYEVLMHVGPFTATAPPPPEMETRAFPTPDSDFRERVIRDLIRTRVIVDSPAPPARPNATAWQKSLLAAEEWLKMAHIENITLRQFDNDHDVYSRSQHLAYILAKFADHVTEGLRTEIDNFKTRIAKMQDELDLVLSAEGTVSVSLNDREVKVLHEMMEQKDMSAGAVLRHMFRTGQLVDHYINHGYRVMFHREVNGVTEVVDPFNLGPKSSD